MKKTQFNKLISIFLYCCILLSLILTGCGKSEELTALQEKYDSLEDSYNKLEEELNKLQNLPDLTVSLVGGYRGDKVYDLKLFTSLESAAKNRLECKTTVTRDVNIIITSNQKIEELYYINNANVIIQLQPININNTYTYPIDDAIFNSISLIIKMKNKYYYTSFYGISP